MKIYIKDLRRGKYEFEVEQNTTILEAKHMYAEAIGGEPRPIEIIYNGRILEDHQTFEDYKIPDGHCLVTVARKTKRPSRTPVDEEVGTSGSGMVDDGPDFESSLNFAVEMLALDPMIASVFGGDRDILRNIAMQANMETMVMEMHENMLDLLKTLINREFFIAEEDYEPLQYLMEQTGNPVVAIQSYVACHRDVAWAVMVAREICRMLELVQIL